MIRLRLQILLASLEEALSLSFYPSHGDLRIRAVLLLER